MAGEKGWLIYNTEADLVTGEDRAGPFAASARVEIVAVKIEQHDAGAFDAFEQRIEPRRVEAPRIVELVEIAKGRGRRGNDRVHLIRGVGRHQRKKSAERLSGQHDAMIALALQLPDQLDQPPCAGGQCVAVA